MRCRRRHSNRGLNVWDRVDAIRVQGPDLSRVDLALLKKPGQDDLIVRLNDGALRMMVLS